MSEKWKQKILLIFPFAVLAAGMILTAAFFQMCIRDRNEPERTAPFFAAAMFCRMSGTRCSMGRFVVNFGSVGSQK